MVDIQNLTKYYGGKPAIQNISFQLRENEVVGFIGPNGAGKSTTLNIMAGVIPSTSGTVTIEGYDIAEEPVKAKRQIGFLPEIPPLYPDMKVHEYLRFVAGMKGVPASQRKVEIERVMALLKITNVQGRLIRNLSKGYKQRVGFAQALLGNPPILILDEPTVGLDPTQLMEIRDLIMELKHNHAIILSSHILGEISAICDRILIINHGVIKADDTLENLEENMQTSGVILRLKLQGGTRTEIPRIIRGVHGVTNVSNLQFVKTGVYTIDVEIEDNDCRNGVLAALLENDIEVLEVNEDKKDLEQVFTKLVNAEPTKLTKEDLLDEVAPIEYTAEKGESETEDAIETETKAVEIEDTDKTETSTAEAEQPEDASTDEEA